VNRALLVLALACALTSCSHLVVLHDPLTAAEHNDLGVAYEAKQQGELAEREYQNALRKDPHFATARINLGNVAAQQQRWKQAERCYRAALRDRPADPDAMNNLAVVLLRQGKSLDEAESLASQAVAADQADSSYRATLAEVRQARR
jgi:tetratricopeptide (TPR) repeat protein